jgi:hypothetical protein
MLRTKIILILDISRIIICSIFLYIKNKLNLIKWAKKNITLRKKHYYKH